jgi:hypothetical protein
MPPDPDLEASDQLDGYGTRTAPTPTAVGGLAGDRRSGRTLSTRYGKRCTATASGNAVRTLLKREFGITATLTVTS